MLSGTADAELVEGVEVIDALRIDCLEGNVDFAVVTAGRWLFRAD
jgi:hypothetical protein